jgi:WD40 repeat protein
VIFSADSQLLVGPGETRVCVWNTETGELDATLELSNIVPRVTGPSLAGVGDGPAPMRLVDERFLRTFTLGGVLVASLDLASAFPGIRLTTAKLSRDAATLLALMTPDVSASQWDLIAIDTVDGGERWRRALPADAVPWLTFSSDGYVVRQGGEIYRIDDGEIVGHDVPSFPPMAADLGPGGRKKLMLGELVGEWDLSAGKLLGFHGSHSGRVMALDMSRDGRYLASHARQAVMWELHSDFSSSRPVVQGGAGDASWNVAIAPDGAALASSGDNLAFFGRDGLHQFAGPPPPAAFDCLSPDWSFSPRGDVVAGSHYAGIVEVWDARALRIQRGLPTANCGGGVAFSPDGSLLVTSSLELFETTSWGRVWTQPATAVPRGASPTAESAVEFSSDGREIVVTRCSGNAFDTACSSTRYSAKDGALLGALPELQGDRVRYSPESHWLLSRNLLLHLPSGAILDYASEAEVAAFTPNGDVIAGLRDGSLVRYCRSDE